jgi:hypothetical protein
VIPRGSKEPRGSVHNFGPLGPAYLITACFRLVRTASG